jgi:hypothetical protein
MLYCAKQWKTVKTMLSDLTDPIKKIIGLIQAIRIDGFFGTSIFLSTNMSADDVNVYFRNRELKGFMKFVYKD